VVIVTITLNYHFQGDASEGDRATPRDPSGSLGLVADYLNLSLFKQGHPASRGTMLTPNRFVMISPALFSPRKVIMGGY
jgi:hypothetical protein